MNDNKEKLRSLQSEEQQIAINLSVLKAKQFDLERLIALERATILSTLLGQPDLINALAPEHDRSSCSDTNVINGGFNRVSQGGEIFLPRCMRCFLLTVAKDKEWPMEYKARLTIEVSEPWKGTKE